MEKEHGFPILLEQCKQEFAVAENHSWDGEPLAMEEATYHFFVRTSVPGTAWSNLCCIAIAFIPYLPAWQPVRQAYTEGGLDCRPVHMGRCITGTMHCPLRCMGGCMSMEQVSTMLAFRRLRITMPPMQVGSRVFLLFILLRFAKYMCSLVLQG
ncbi:unnamed protein product [Ectocarpus fasciculatus]